MLGDLIAVYKQRWLRSSLLRRMGVLTSGTLLAQAIQLLSFVALAKLFTMLEVGTYSMFIAIVGTLAPVAVLGYDMLVPAASDEDISPLLKALLFLMLPIALMLGLVALLLSYEHALAIGLWVAGAIVQRLAEMHNVRCNRFRWVALGRLGGPLMMFSLLAVFVYLGVHDIDSLITWQAGLTLAMGMLYAVLTLPRNLITASHTWEQMRTALRKASNAPLYLMPSNLFNLVAYNVPVLVIGHWFGPELAAQYAYVLRFGFGPVGLLGGTIYQVFYGFLAEAARTGNEAMFGQFLRARRHIGYAALAAAVGIALIYPFAFRYVLGPMWMTAGWISMIFAPFFAAMLFVTTQSVVLNVFAKQQYELKSQVQYLGVSLLSFGLAVTLGNAWVGFVMFSALGCLRYALLLRNINKVLNELKLSRHEYLARI